MQRTRFITATGETQNGEFYFITSLTTENAPIKTIMNIIRNHWSIENNLHWIKDNILNEDRSTTKTKSGPQNLALLRSFVLHIIHKNQLKPKETRENLANRTNQISHIINKSISYQS